MECTLCKKQYVEKSEVSFNIRLNSHCKDVKKPDAIFAHGIFADGGWWGGSLCPHKKKKVLKDETRLLLF